jgi:hypothetical protein
MDLDEYYEKAFEERIAMKVLMRKKGITAKEARKIMADKKRRSA